MAPSRRDRDERTRRPAADLDEDYEDEDEDEDEDTGYDEDEPEPRPRQAGRSSGLSTVEAAQAALRQITAITAKSAEGVTSVKPVETGWIAGVELLEARRVPSSSDTLALYEVEIDANGDLTSYRRIQRYPRGRSEVC